MCTNKKMAKRYKLIPVKGDELPKIKITSSESAEKYARQFYFEDIEIYESSFLILLSRSNETIGWVKISSGGIVGTVMDVKLIARYCISHLASSAILVHNHPSGNLNPSQADIQVTDKIKNALKFVETSLIDHLILTKDSYTSFADSGLL
jgi:DNA repair protein RadC